MFSFILVWIAVSIAVSILSAWLKIIPTYSKRIHRVLVHVIDTAILTVVLTILLISGIYPHWTIVFVLIFVSLMLSVWFTNRLDRKGAKPDDKSPQSEG